LQYLRGTPGKGIIEGFLIGLDQLMLVSQELGIGYSTSTKVWGNLVTWKSKIQSPLWKGEGWTVAIIQ